jgi:hypothetical protein
MWRLLAVSLPFCIAGTRAAANAHKTVIPVKARWMGLIKILTHSFYLGIPFELVCIVPQISILCPQISTHSLPPSFSMTWYITFELHCPTNLHCVI